MIELSTRVPFEIAWSSSAIMSISDKLKITTNPRIRRIALLNTECTLLVESVDRGIFVGMVQPCLAIPYPRQAGSRMKSRLGKIYKMEDRQSTGWKIDRVYVCL